MDGTSLSITAELITQLHQLFPDVVTEGRIDFDRLKAALGAADALAPSGPDHYELRWAGKDAARREVQRSTTATLVPEPDHSVDFETSGNVFIEGENLEVLRVLQRGYFGKVKMIYIDPPYNTGSDSFVYPDDFAERRRDYEQAIGQRDADGLLNRQDLWKKNTPESGHYHSSWLSMMWPRLYLSRNLLREDGVIFVSIDDHEVHNLRLLLNEIFGEENFVAELVWQKKYAVSNDHQGISPVHEYILVFQKSAAFQRNLLARTEEQTVRYQNPDNDPRGAWTSGEYVGSKSRFERPTLWYAIKHPKTGEEVWPDENAAWRYSKDKHEQMEAEGRLYWGPNQSYKKPRLKRYLAEIQQGVVPGTWLPFKEVGHNDEGQKETAELLGKKIFSYPKPVRLLNRLLTIGAGKNDLILDFFGGSGTTAQAVLELNAQDGGNRQFLLVQMPEVVEPGTDAHKAGYRTIADITRTRLQKVSEKLRAAQAGQLALAGPAPDTGFRAYRLTASNFRAWRSDVASGPDMLAQLELFQNPLRPLGPTGTPDAILTELLLKMTGGPGLLPLSVKVTLREVAGLPIHEVADGLAWLALSGISPAVVEAAVAAKPQRLIVLGHLFGPENPDEQVSNARLQLTDAGVALQLI